jgi:hypothetical protein
MLACGVVDLVFSALGTFCVGMADIRALANSQQVGRRQCPPSIAILFFLDTDTTTTDWNVVIGNTQAQAMKVNLSADLKHLYIAIEGTLDWEYLTVREDSTAQYSFLSPLPPAKTPSSFSSSSGSPDSSPTLALIDLNTSLLWSRRQELKLIAVQSAYISSHLSHIDTTLQLMGDKWGHSIGEFNTRCSDFSNMLQGTHRPPPKRAHTQQ